MPEFEHVEHVNLSKEKWDTTKYTKLGSEGFTRWLIGVKGCKGVREML